MGLRRSRLWLAALAVLAACATRAPAAAPVQPVIGLPAGTDGFPWWNDTVFYEVFVRSFSDSDGDGVGDLSGLIERLDYLNDGDPATQTDLGVTGLWLMPIHPSPSYHGYDVSNYYQINPPYGTLDDFRRLLDEAHRRGIRVIIDLVLNHTSSQHAWFQDAARSDSAFRNWYVWSDIERPGRWWPADSGYYYGYFEDGMPDLNYTNAAVTSEMQAVARFWLADIGVDGFRVDAAKYLIEAGAIEDTPATHAWLREFRRFYTGVNPQAVTVGEVWSGSSVAAGYARGDEFDLVFEFDLAEGMLLSAGLGNTRALADRYAASLRLFRPGQFAAFLSNHDQIRVMQRLGGRLPNARAAAALLLTGPGVPFIYYGEEIGMLGGKPDPDIRTPMQWTGGAQAGFTTGQPWRAVNPDFPEKNVEAQAADPDSLLSFYRQLIKIRNDHAALRVGDTFLLDTGSDLLFGLLRASRQESVLVLVNLSAEPVADYRLSLARSPLEGGYVLAPILGEPATVPLTAAAGGGFADYRPAEAIAGHATLIYQLQAAP